MTKQKIKVTYMKDEKINNENNGIIPTMFRRIICTLYKGHCFVRVTPKDINEKALFECTYCKNNTYGKPYYLIYWED